MNKDEALQKFQQAILGQETAGGNYTAVNEDSGAAGAYQFLPETWSHYAHEYDFDDYADTNPSEVPADVQDSLFMRYASDLYDTFGGDVRYMADAHYAGVGAAIEHYNAGTLPTNEEGNYPSQSEYANSVAEQAGFTGDILNAAMSQIGGDVTNHAYSGQQDVQAIDYHTFDNVTPSFWDKFSTGFANEATNTGFASMAQSLWGDLFHSNTLSGIKPITQEDVDYVKAALPDDPDTQKFVLLHGRDSEEVRWLVNQKLVDKKRQADIARYNDGCAITIANAGGFLGGVLDPLMLVPVGEAFSGLKIMSRLANATADTSKVAMVAARATKVGLENAAISTANNAMREAFNGNKMSAKEYGWDAATAFLCGSVLGAVGGIFSNIKANKKVSQEIAETADQIETKAVEEAADLHADLSNETIGDAMKLHDKTYGDTLDSKFYKPLEAKGRVVAANSADIAKLIKDKTGMKLSDDAKAFYVPNEDYAVLLKDRIKPEEVDDLLIHEMGVHAGLKKSIGERDYNQLMDKVSALSNQDGNVFHKARDMAGSYDPQEIFAKAVENNMLPQGIIEHITNSFNNKFIKAGSSFRVNAEQMRDLMEKQLNNERETLGGYHFNMDGSSAFGGVMFSKNNLINPQTFAKYLTLEQPLFDGTASGTLKNATNRVGDFLRQGVLGMGLTSVSNTFRKMATNLWADTRGTGAGYVRTISAETNKQRLERLLNTPYQKFINDREEWCKNNLPLGSVSQNRAANLEFNRQTVLCYNAKYGKNVANIPEEFPPEIIRAAEHLKEYRDKQIMLGKRSATDVGSPQENMIKSNWNPVDDELWRIVDNDQRVKFLNNFVATREEIAQGITAYNKAVEFLTKYYHTYAKRDIVKEKLLRVIDVENERRKAYNDAIAPQDMRSPLTMLSRVVSENSIDTWLNEHIPKAVDFMLKGNMDATMVGSRQSSGLGHLPFLKERVPIDTTGVLKMPNNQEFSFDNNLRNFDLDTIIPKNITRFSGEASVKNVFGDDDHLQQFMQKVKNELGLAVQMGKINRNRHDAEIAALENGIAELRGMRPKENAIGKIGSLCRIMQNLSYAKNGGMMMFAQLGELGGSISYGGLSQIAHTFKPLAKLMDDFRWGKVKADEVESIVKTSFGTDLARNIWTRRYGDSAIRDALTDKQDLVNRALIGIGDKVAELGKVTSWLNRLPKMTDNMYSGMLGQTVVDSMDWAFGKEFSKIRNPFTKAKLKACHILPEQADAIKADIRKYGNNSVNDFRLDTDTWQMENPETYMKWYGMVTTQAERAIVSGSRSGTKALMKDYNSLTRMLFLFKDYNMRAVNAQTLRAIGAHDLDDGMATALSIVTNTAAYAARATLMYGAIKATGADDKAQEYWDSMFSDNALLRAVAFRSTIIGSPLSVLNDTYEAATGAPSIRTTVDRGKGNAGLKAQNVGDFLGNLVSQAPALQTAGTPIDVMRYFYNASNDEANKRDFKKALKAIPVPNFLPFTAYINHVVDQSDYPTKRQKK